MKAAGFNVEVKIVDWTTNATDMGKGTGGWNVSTTGFCSGPLLRAQPWGPQLIGSPHVEDDDVLRQAYKAFFNTSDLAGRKKIWLDIEKRVLGEAYMIKVMDFADIRAYNTKYENLKPYYFTRFWDVWLK